MRCSSLHQILGCQSRVIRPQPESVVSCVFSGDKLLSKPSFTHSSFSVCLALSNIKYFGTRSSPPFTIPMEWNCLHFFSVIVLVLTVQLAPNVFWSSCTRDGWDSWIDWQFVLSFSFILNALISLLWSVDGLISLFWIRRAALKVIERTSLRWNLTAKTWRKAFQTIVSQKTNIYTKHPCRYSDNGVAVGL